MPRRGTIVTAVAIVVVIVGATGYAWNTQQPGSRSQALNGGTSTASGSADGLRLDLEVRPGGNGTYEIGVQEVNVLASPNNVTAGNRWPYPASRLDPFDACGTSSSPIGFAVFQGNYGLNNFSGGDALALFNTTYATSCTTTLYPAAYYAFDPASRFASVSDSHGDPLGNQSISVSLLSAGYWTGGEGYWGGSSAPAAFHRFQGVYTVVAADEWGAVAVEHFGVVSPGT